MRITQRLGSFGIALLCMALGAYLVFHARQLSYSVASMEAHTNAISHRDAVVLTGGPGRIKAGLALLRDGRADHVLVSGVSETYSKAQLPAVPGFTNELRDCCVTLGFDARNTAGNGEESAAWLADHGAGEIFLITSRYHMPRAVVEMTRWAPNIRITPVSVAEPRRIKRQVKEFLKYSAALARLRLLASQSA